jgi:membrane protein implicated in regulation of membrane protease activity
MADVLGLSFGWLLIVVGTLFLVVEALNPGFFIAVPGTVLIILGILLVLGVDVFSTPFGLIVAVILTVAASIVTIWIYKRINPDTKSPTTVSRDSLVGMEGMVLVKVIPDSLSGKVRVAGQDWSARSEEGIIPVGSKVRVVKSEGVHIVVKEVV